MDALAYGERMTWATELEWMRRYLRDPDGSIWSEPYLRHLYNDVQRDFQNQTKVLEDVIAQRIPPAYQFAYLQEWEYRFLPSGESQFYQALTQHDDYVICHRWEPQQITGIDADVSDYGAHFTQPFEAFQSELPGELVRVRFPANCGTVLMVSYDEEPLSGTTHKIISSTDPSYITKEGEPVAYFQVDETDNSYVLYPRPSASFFNELSGEAMALFADEDTEDTTTGTIAVRTGSYDSAFGMSVDIIDSAYNVLLLFTVTPTAMQLLADEPDFPTHLRKYIRYGTVARAYGGNTDGRIKSLAELWQARYTLGVDFTRRYCRYRRQDRDYRFTTKGHMRPHRRNLRHPRLPDGYPAVNP